MSEASWLERFQSYFSREIAERAARSISDGSEVELRIGSSWGSPDAILTFYREGGANRVKAGSAHDPQILFELTPNAAEEILQNGSEDLGEIGIAIFKKIVRPKDGRDDLVRIQVRAGFLTLLRRGYLGVLTAGGAAFAQMLASHGVAGMGAIQSALKKSKKS